MSNQKIKKGLLIIGMSLNKENELRAIAKIKCRELRRRSTNAENIFWQRVRNRKFLGKKFYRQYPIFYDLNGKESFYIADFYCHGERMVIELDGGIHESQKAQDALRSGIMNDMGIQVIRFNNFDIESNVDHVLKRLEAVFNNSKSP